MVREVLDWGSAASIQPQPRDFLALKCSPSIPCLDLQARHMAAGMCVCVDICPHHHTTHHQYGSTLRDANIQHIAIHKQPNCNHLSTPACGQGSAGGSQITYGCNSLSFSAPAQLAVWLKQVQGNLEAILLQSQGGEPWMMWG